MRKCIWIGILFITACAAFKIAKDTNPSIPNPIPVVNVPQADVVTGSACSKYYWLPNRGIAPIGYLKFIVKSYQEMLCETTVAKQSVYDKMNKAKIPHYYDALYQYKEFTGNDVVGNELRKTFTLLIGLGMMESSGNYSCGHDDSASTTPSHTNTETGAWQFSYDAIGVSDELRNIYDYYKAHPSECMLEMAKEGVKKIQLDGYVKGGAGYDFQVFFRSCPAAQAKYAAVMIRVNAPHFGPLNIKKAFYNKDCETMLKLAEKSVVCN